MIEKLLMLLRIESQRVMPVSRSQIRGSAADYPAPGPFSPSKGLAYRLIHYVRSLLTIQFVGIGRAQVCHGAQKTETNCLSITATVIMTDMPIYCNKAS